MEIRELTAEEITAELLDSFVRTQDVTVVWKFDPEADKWGVALEPRTDDWDSAEREKMVDRLAQIAQSGGLVLGSVQDGKLLGFAAVDPEPIGTEGRYRDFSALHVAQNVRNQGLGTRMFLRAAEWAQDQGAPSLIISSHPAVETQGFYRTLGCVDAAEAQPALAKEHPDYRQLEFPL